MYNPRVGCLSGHLRETVMRVYDVRPSTADSIMDMAEAMADLAKREYKRGRTDMYIELQKDKEEDNGKL